MSITVNNIDGGYDTFPNATGWHVDDTGYLHITVTGNGNCATFHPQSWRSVEREELAKAEDGK